MLRVEKYRRTGGLIIFMIAVGNSGLRCFLSILMVVGYFKYEMSNRLT